jgi:hypothetical protein
LKYWQISELCWATEVDERPSMSEVVTEGPSSHMETDPWYAKIDRLRRHHISTFLF